MRAKYARIIRAGIGLARMGWFGDAMIPAYIDNDLMLRSFARERGNMTHRSRAGRRNDFTPFRRTGVVELQFGPQSAENEGASNA